MPHCSVALDKPSNAPLPCSLPLPQGLTENIHFAMGPKNPACWNSGNQVCNPKSSTSHGQITSLFLSMSISHMSYTKSTPWRCTGEKWVEELLNLLTTMLKALGDTWPQTAPKGTKQYQENRPCCVWPWKMIHVVTATVGWSYLEDLIKLSICQVRGKKNRAVRRHSKLTYRG